MKTSADMRVLLIEDDSADASRLAKTLEDLPSVACELVHQNTLRDGLRVLRSSAFDVILLDLELPDCQGVASFMEVREQASSVPILVLAGRDGDEVAQAALSAGAYDCLVKKEVEGRLLSQSLRYAVERAKLQAELAEARVRQRHADEIADVAKIQEQNGTAVTAGLYSAAGLRECAGETFDSFVIRYGAILDQTLEDRMHKGVTKTSSMLRELGRDLGFMRASPRDLIEIHTQALRTKTQDAPWEKAQAFLEEGRLSVLELMGNLAGYYRRYYLSSSPEGGENA